MANFASCAQGYLILHLSYQAKINYPFHLELRQGLNLECIPKSAKDLNYAFIQMLSYEFA